MQVKSTQTQHINSRNPKKYTRSYYWKSYIKFQLALNLYYFWNCKYFLLPIINYAMERVHSVSCNIVYHMSDKDSVPLVDNGFKIIPRIQISTHGQLISMFVGGVLFGFLRLFIKMDGNNYSFAIVFSRYAVLCSIAIMCRVISFLSTILPSPHVHCHNEDFNPPTGWGIITALNLAKGCGDLIFSSHMMHFLIPLFLIVWYALPSYDQISVTKTMDKIRGLKNKIQQSTEPQQIRKLRKKTHKTYQKLHKNYRSDMIMNAQKMRSFNWRWALIAFLPFFALIFVVLVISSRGHYTVDVVVSLYFIPFMCYFVMHHWKEEIGKSLEQRVSSLYPKLCKNYIQILNNEDFGVSDSQKITSSDNAHFQVQKQNGTEIISLDQIVISDKKKLKSNGQLTQSSTTASSSKYEAVNGSFGAVVELAKQNVEFLEQEEDEEEEQ